MDGANGQIKEVTKEESLKKEEELKIKIFIIPRPTKTTTRRIITYKFILDKYKKPQKNNNKETIY